MAIAAQAASSTAVIMYILLRIQCDLEREERSSAVNVCLTGSKGGGGGWDTAADLGRSTSAAKSSTGAAALGWAQDGR